MGLKLVYRSSPCSCMHNPLMFFWIYPHCSYLVTSSDIWMTILLCQHGILPSQFRYSWGSWLATVSSIWIRIRGRIIDIFLMSWRPFPSENEVAAHLVYMETVLIICPGRLIEDCSFNSVILFRVVFKALQLWLCKKPFCFLCSIHKIPFHRFFFSRWWITDLLPEYTRFALHTDSNQRLT